MDDEEDEWVSLADHAAHYVMAALRASRADLLPADRLADSDEPEAVGTRLVRLIFGGRIEQDDFDEQLAALARDPDAQALESLISDALADDREAAAAVFGTLADFYRRRAKAGSVQAMADLGNLLRDEGDFEGAKAAYQQAIDA